MGVRVRLATISLIASVLNLGLCASSIEAQNIRTDKRVFLPYQAFNPKAGIRYYVVLGSWRESELSGAGRRKLVSCLGFDSGFMPSGVFRGFREGYYVDVWGAFNKAEANRALSVARKCSPTAYIKQAEWLGDYS